MTRERDPLFWLALGFAIGGSALSAMLWMTRGNAPLTADEVMAGANVLGLAFALTTVTVQRHELRLQRADLALQREELRARREELQMQREAQQEQAKTQAFALEVTKAQLYADYAHLRLQHAHLLQSIPGELEKIYRQDTFLDQAERLAELIDGLGGLVNGLVHPQANNGREGGAPGETDGDGLVQG